MAPLRRSVVFRTVMAAAVLACLPAFTACTPGQPAPSPAVTSGAPQRPVVVGALDTAEGALIAELYSGAIRSAGVPSSVKLNVGGRAATLEALRSGKVQLVPAYTGSLLEALGGSAKDTGDDAVKTGITTALRKPLAILDASGAQDREVVVVTKVTAEKYQLKTLEDLGKVCSQTVFAAAADFSGGAYGSQALKSGYSCTPKRILTYGMTGGPDGGPSLPSGQTQPSSALPQPLRSLLEDEAQVAVMLSTDPAIGDNDLVVLEDNRRALLPEQVVPVVDEVALPDKARDAVNNVSRTLTADDLVTMNRAIRGDQARTPHEVAVSWLKERGITG